MKRINGGEISIRNLKLILSDFSFFLFIITYSTTSMELNPTVSIIVNDLSSSLCPFFLVFFLLFQTTIIPSVIIYQ